MYWRITIFITLLFTSTALDACNPELLHARLTAARRIQQLARDAHEHHKFREAVALYEQAVLTLKATYDEYNSDVATALTELSTDYQEQGDYAKAEQVLLYALQIEEGLKVPDSMIASTLDRLGLLYTKLGMYSKAEPLLLRASNLQRMAWRAAPRDIMHSLVSLASLYYERGDHVQAESLLARVIGSIDEWQADVLDIAHGLNMLGIIYQQQGAYAKAEDFLLRALKLRENNFNHTDMDVAQSLASLATLYQSQGAYAKAEPLYLRAISILKPALENLQPTLAECLNSLAALYMNQGDYKKAGPLLRQAISITERTVGREHPEMAMRLSNLALFRWAMGAYNDAAALYGRALDIYTRLLGNNHPTVTMILYNLAMLYVAQGAYVASLSYLSRALENRERQLRLELPRLSAMRQRDLLGLFREENEAMISLHADALPADPKARDLALTTVLRRKGRALDALVNNQRALYSHTAPTTPQRLELQSISRELSRRMRDPIDLPTTTSRSSAIAGLRSRIDSLEAELYRMNTDTAPQAEPVTIDRIRAAMPRNSALVEFVRYHRFDNGTPRPLWKNERYVAYILPKQGDPSWVALGDAATIDNAIDAVLSEMHMASDVKATKLALRRLDTLVLEPLRSHLAAISHVILSPDSKLNLIPFEALLDAEGRYELEQWLISYVTSGRDLLRTSMRLPARSLPTIVADPDYGAGRPFVRLPGAALEATEVASYLSRAQILMGYLATKSTLASIAAPSVIHIATHGFFTRGTLSTKIDPTTPAAGRASAQFQIRERGIFVTSSEAETATLMDDPTDALDRAGLAMAGANTSPDGIVSAREIANYDWWGTQLVVLSACETGVGAVPSSEGVYGLRRALVLAGAQSQVVSLWSVNDTSVRALMRAFYDALGRGLGRGEALRRAKLQMLRQPQFSHPYHWAGFIMAGDWTPLDKGTMNRGGTSPP